MKLTDFIVDIGRVIAYYPNLKKVTGSTTSSILLCQFIYWMGKEKDPGGWIYKSSEEIEEETGLSYYEQKTAKKELVDKNLMEQERRRLEHTSRYRVNQVELNRRWEEITTNKASLPAEPLPGSIEDFSLRSQAVTSIEPSKNATEKRGDLVDLIIDTNASLGLQKMKEKMLIREKAEKRFHINMDSKKWEGFIDFLYVRETKYNEPVNRFLDWSLDNGFDPRFWTPEKMRTLHPQAYVEEKSVIRENFIDKTPKKEEEIVYTPMPKDIGRKREVE
jgi:hypothetical protein